MYIESLERRLAVRVIVVDASPNDDVVPLPGHAGKLSGGVEVQGWLVLPVLAAKRPDVAGFSVMIFLIGPPTKKKSTWYCLRKNALQMAVRFDTISQRIWIKQLV